MPEEGSELTIREKRKKLAEMSDEEKEELLRAINNDELPSRGVEEREN